MSIGPDYPPPPDRTPPPLPVSIDPTSATRRGRPVLSWVMIVLLAALIGVLQRFRGSEEPVDETDQPGAELTVFEFQARYFVGAADLLPQSPQTWYPQVKPLNVGTVAQRLRFVVLAGELAGPDEALAQLDELSKRLEANQTKLSDDEAAVQQTLDQIYRNRADDRPADAEMSAEQRGQLLKQLGWFGELALNPKDDNTNPSAREAVVKPARTLLVVVFLAFGTLSFLGVGGLVALVILVSLLATGRIPDRLAPPSGRGGFYAEAFAVWLGLFVVMGVAASLVPLGEFQMLGSALASFLSLIALAWPCLRGVPWRTVREDIGWTLGPRPFVEPFAGIGAYVMTIPLVGIGLVATLVLMQVQQFFDGGGGGEFDRTAIPSHPILPLLANGGTWQRVQALLLASVAALVVEETVFRGLLYRHLRDATCAGGRMRSFLWSAAINALVFAVIHPQGLVAVPALMAVAFGLTLAREWRGSLLPPMILHGIHNGVLLMLVITAFG